MKNIFRSVGLFLLASTVFSCSSDDNSTPNQSDKIIVVDKMEETNYYDMPTNGGQSTENVIFSETAYTFSYNTNAKVSAINVVQHDEIPLGGYYYKAELKVEYNANGSIGGYKSINKDTGEIETDVIYEYNQKGQVVKGTDRVDNYLYTYAYNSANQIEEIKANANSYESTYKYEYDTHGNIVLVFDTEKPNNKDSFTYDNKHNAFKNMNFDLTYNDYEFTYNIIPFAKPSNNIVSHAGVYNENSVIKYEYNGQGYPTKATEYDKDDSTKLKSVKKYTYKEIESKK